MSSYLICFFIGILAFILGDYMKKCGTGGDEGCYAACGKHSVKRLIEKYTGVLIMIVGIGLMIFGPLTINYANHQKEIHEAVENGYTIYIDGREVLVNTINLGEYSNVTIDKDNHYIIITTTD